MPLTVRFPNGRTVTYNTAAYLKWGESAWTLYTANPASGGSWAATISPASGCIVETVAPCRLTVDQEEALDVVLANLRRADAVKLGTLKRALRGFDIRRRTWRTP